MCAGRLVSKDVFQSIASWKGAALSGLLGAAAANDRLDGLEHDEEVEAHRLVLEVVEVVGELSAGFGGRGALAVTDLRPAGEAGADHVAQVVERNLLREPGGELGALGARADEAHLTAKNVPELRNLVDACLAQKAAEAGNARVVFGGPAGALGFGVDEHGAELVDLEVFILVSDARLREEDGTFRRELDREGDEGEERKKEQQADQRDDARGEALRELQRLLHVEAFAEEKIAGAQAFELKLSGEALKETADLFDLDAAHAHGEKVVDGKLAAALLHGDDDAMNGRLQQGDLFDDLVMRGRSIAQPE